MDGWVKICIYNVDGWEVIFNIVGWGEIVGEMVAIEEVFCFIDVIIFILVEVCSVLVLEFYNFF